MFARRHSTPHHVRPPVLKKEEGAARPTTRTPRSRAAGRGGPAGSPPPAAHVPDSRRSLTRTPASRTAAPSPAPAYGPSPGPRSGRSRRPDSGTGMMKRWRHPCPGRNPDRARTSPDGRRLSGTAGSRCLTCRWPAVCVVPARPGSRHGAALCVDEHLFPCRRLDLRPRRVSRPHREHLECRTPGTGQRSTSDVSAFRPSACGTGGESAVLLAGQSAARRIGPPVSGGHAP